MKAFVLFTLLTALAVGLSAQVYGDPIVSWDFADGIPAGWENESTSGISHWEYRGPDTSPNNTVGSQGSCGGTSQPVNAPSVGNGYVIFDGNYWDDPNGPCGNLGSGPDPAPHTAWLTTSSVDLSDFTAVVMTFRQQFNHFNATTRVLASTDGGENFTQIFINPTTPSSNSGPGIWSNINLSSFTGQSDVRFKFEFNGTYYWWMLDDITLYTPNTNDLLISNPKYTLYDGTLDPEGFGDMEYSGYPSVMLPPFNFKSTITNIGGAQQTDVSLNVRITNQNNQEVYNSNSEPLNLNSGVTQVFSIEEPYQPAPVLGQYTIDFTAEQNQVEETPENNEVQRYFSITPYSYMFDRGPMEDAFFPSGIYVGQPYQVGNLYEVRENALQLHGLGVGIAEPSEPGTEVFGVVYNFARDSVLAQTAPYTINAWDVNQPGDDKIISLAFEESLAVHKDSVYFVMIATTDLEGTFHVARAGAAFAQASIVRYPEQNGLFFMLRAPKVRAHLFPVAASPGCLDPQANNFNPSADVSDGSCRYHGCIYPEASNYDPEANFAIDVCIFEGCTDPEAANYNEQATVDDGSCEFPGCTDPEAENYDETANVDDGSCDYLGCTDPEADNYDEQATIDDDSCEYFGCMDPEAANYDENANVDDGSCEYPGCIDPDALNFDPDSNVDDGSCVYDSAFISASDTTGCVPHSVTFVNQTVVSDEGICEFYLDDELYLDECVAQFTIEFTEPGMYFVNYEYTINEVTSSYTAGPIVVSGFPDVPEFEFDEDEILLTCTNCEDLEIQWYFNDVAIEGANSETLTPELNGNYFIEVTNDAGCTSTGESEYVQVVSVTEHRVTDIVMYPNPANNSFIVNSGGHIERIRVLSNDGRMVLDLDHLGVQPEINVSHLSNGLYLVLINQAEKLSTLRILIQH